MASYYFRRLSGDDAAGRYLAGDATVGPWSPALQHGGPPNALAVTLADRVVRASTGRDDLVALRLATDFVGPVPVGELDATVRIVRAARSAALAEVVLTAGDRECLRARVWFVRAADTAELASPDVAPPPLPDAPSSSAQGWSFGYARSLDWRFVSGGPDELGPAAVWVRSRTALIDGSGDPAGTDLSGLARVVLAADSSSGVSATLDWADWSFVNVDLDVHLARPLEGDWVLLDAETQLGPSGSALARSTVSDSRGVVGTSLQTLVVAPMPSR